MAEQDKRLRVVLVDDHAVVREGVRMILENDPVIDVVGESGTAAGAMETIGRERPDLVLLDLLIGSERTFGVIGTLVREYPDTRVLVLTGADDEELHKRALIEGAHGLLRKDKAGAVLVTAIKKVCEGEAWIDRTLTATVLRESAARVRQEDESAARVRSLTAREREIVELVAAGHSNRTIAERLELSEKTVRNRLTVIFEKLEVASRLELALFASQHGIEPNN